ncbi:MAG: TIGR03767 family metallophosphoesterase [Actinomycetota bacterium]|nr:TIGR03767 family metallophosphoesterase [Actinomycetota bacterium]MDQ6933844.1 TIGR03767 family metallophosphoesterase [Actinomycetota bacterium]
MSGPSQRLRADHLPLTLDRTLVPDQVLRRGTVGAYRTLSIEAGELHLVRTDLTTAHARAGTRWPLAVFAHATDLQLADVQSPGRFEFCDRYREDPSFHKLLPMHRPQEALAARAAEAMVRSLNALISAPVSGAAIDLVLTTGDAIDNAQWNETQMFLALLDGGLVRPGSGVEEYEGVQALQWPDDSFWQPDGTGTDPYQRRLGYPRLPGLLDAALADFVSPGLRLPWLACLGNHEVLVQGVALLTEPLRARLTGDRKSAMLPAGLDRSTLHERFLVAPEHLLTGEARVIGADGGRRPIGRAEFVAAHLTTGSRPHGHGFSEQNRRDATAYYVHDVGRLRYVCLDTTCAAGGGDGWLDQDQGRWLEARLAEVHSEYAAPDGTLLRTGATDQVVVVFSHHGPDTMTNTRGLVVDDHHGRLTSGPALEALLHRFGNVVAWVNGHTHRNRVTPRPDPTGRSGGFWEITTSALADWPCQTRVVEILDNRDGSLSLVCTMADHDGIVRPDPALPWDGRWLSGLHRELAGNEPWHGFDSGRRGRVEDRNVDLRLRAPFPLDD